MRLFSPHPPQPPPGPFPDCNCINFNGRRHPRLAPRLHLEEQDTSCAAWRHVVQRVDEAAEGGETVFSPLEGLDGPGRAQIRTLPKSVAKLVTVRELKLYGSHLSRLPPEIGAMTALRYLDVYRSICLHFFPYELTRCMNLRDSRVSTRAIYGNYKFRAPFPFLGKTGTEVPIDAVPSVCSVCSQPFGEASPKRRWITLRLGTDDLPLFVCACSESCVEGLPPPAAGYIEKPHLGGRRIQQPAGRH